MRKTILLSIILLCGFCSYSFAEEQDGRQPDLQQPEMRQEEPRGERPDMRGDNRMRMKGGMMMGMHPTVVATSDGGVVVLAGGKLAKYDASLNLVKEVEIKGGPKPTDKKADPMEITKPSMQPKEEPADQITSEQAVPPTAE